MHHAFTVRTRPCVKHLLSSFQQTYEAETHYYPHFTDRETGAQTLAQGHRGGERWRQDLEPGLSDHPWA